MAWSVGEEGLFKGREDDKLNLSYKISHVQFLLNIPTFSTMFVLFVIRIIFRYTFY